MRDRLRRTSSTATTLADLARSGLGEDDALRMRIQPIGAAQVRRLTRRERPAGGYLLPYLDAAGEDTGFWRVRLLGEPPAGVDDPVRYAQPARSAPRLYLPPVAKLDWESVLASVDVELVLTEGEKKAYAVAKATGRATAGLGGVWSFADRRRGYSLLPDLLAFRLAGRRVLVVFDSDVTTNPQVRDARTALARALASEGAHVRYLTLAPAPDGSKQGVDDLLVREGVDELERQLRERCSTPEAAEKLEAFNRRFAFVENLGRVVRLDHFDARGDVVLYSAQDFKLATANELFTPPPEVKPDGTVKVKAPESLGPAWLAWPGRRAHARLTYEPGRGEVVGEELNLWRAPAIAPVRPRRATELGPYVELRDYLFQHDVDLIPWFERWAAYPLQRPGAKLLTAVLVHGVFQGTGKSALGLTLGKLYGRNFGIVEHDQLYAPFNEWALYKQFVLGDEVFGVDRRKEADALKVLITRDRVTVNLKNVRQFAVPDRINYFFTSNHPDALYLEETDRRFAVVRVDARPLSDAFYREYDAWLRGDGPAKLLWYLRERVDVAGFNPNAPAPHTEAKRALIQVGASEVDVFARQLRDAPAAVLRRPTDDEPLDGDLWSARELASLCFPGEPQRGHSISMGRALLRAGLKRVELPNYALTLYVVRNDDRWQKALPSEAVEHYYRTRRPGARVPLKDVGAARRRY